jgi:hypothetical protein
MYNLRLTNDRNYSSDLLSIISLERKNGLNGSSSNAKFSLTRVKGKTKGSEELPRHGVTLFLHCTGLPKKQSRN